MVAVAKNSELIEIVDYMLTKVRESVLSTPFQASTNPDMWAAAEAAAESAKDNAESALAMLRMRGAAYFPLADAARDILITLAWMALAAPPTDEESGDWPFAEEVDQRLANFSDSAANLESGQKYIGYNDMRAGFTKPLSPCRPYFRSRRTGPMNR